MVGSLVFEISSIQWESVVLRIASMPSTSSDCAAMIDSFLPSIRRNFVRIAAAQLVAFSN